MITVRRSLRPRARRAALLAGAALVGLAAVACVGDTITSTRTGACAGALTATVSAGTMTPTFTWTPTCKVTRLGVLRESDGAEVWGVEAGGNEIAPGVKYGVVPPGAVQNAPAPALVVGQTYDLVLVRTTALGSLEVAGVESFTP